MNNTLEYREQELQRQLKELEAEKVRAITPKLYDYLKENNFVFERKDEAFKPVDDDFEIGVSIPASYGIIVNLYDRKQSKVNVNGYFNRSEIYPIKEFEHSEEELAIEYISNPPVPQKYKVVFTYESDHYVIGTEEDMKAEAKTWFGSGWIPEFDISIKKIQ